MSATTATKNHLRIQTIGLIERQESFAAARKKN
jgi:hypothetical protein